MSPFIDIAGRKIGEDYPPLVIAEIGINHGGSLEEAKKLVDSAIQAGAEVIKHQTHIIDDEMSNHAKKVIPTNAKESIYEIMKNCALDEDDEFKLMKYVQKNGAIFISTPFSREAARRLEKFEVPAFKIGSGECNNYPLIEHIAKYGKPMIVSTGMNSIESIVPSVQIMRNYKIDFALLHCTNIYPTPHNLVRLGAIQSLYNHFPDAVVGLSDHTTSNNACLGAVALGASILERHFTDNYEREGPDISSSMDTIALNQLIQGSNEIYLSRGGEKGPVDEESGTIAFAFASVVSIKEIKRGEKITLDNIWLKRPGGGDYGAKEFHSLIGKTAQKDIPNDQQITKNDIY